MSGAEAISPVDLRARAISFADSLKQAEPAERSGLLAERLRLETVQILSLAPDSAVNEDTALHDLGLDSLMAVELRNRLQVVLERQLSPTLALDYPTLRALRQNLLAEMSFPEDTPGAVGVSIDNIADLTDSEAEALLLAELGKPVHAGKH
jgi:acyl carrier protein